MVISRTPKGITIEVWWQELRHEEDNKKRFMFFHLVDDVGNVFGNQQVSVATYAPPAADRCWRYDTVTFAEPISPSVKSLSFGIYHWDGGIKLLVSDQGLPSSGGRWVVVPIPPMVK